MWAAAAKEITPPKALARIDTKSGFVFSNITLIGTVLAGFGVLTGTAGRLASYEPLTLAALWILVVAVLAALVANLPSIRSHIDPENLTEVRRFYTRNIAVRGWLTRVALFLFAVAFAIALALLIAIAGKDDPPTLGLQWTLGADGKRAVAGHVTGTGLPPGARAETVLAALTAQGTQGTVYAKDVSFADSSGKIDVTVEVDDAPAGTVFRLSTKVDHDSGRLYPERALELTP
jgi:hypothetical protein